MTCRGLFSSLQSDRGALELKGGFLCGGQGSRISPIRRMIENTALERFSGLTRNGTRDAKCEQSMPGAARISRPKAFLALWQVSSIKERQNDEYGQLHASGVHSAGRIVLNLWRLLRSEVKLNVYTFEACVGALLKQRTPHIPHWVLAQWFQGGPGGASPVPFQAMECLTCCEAACWTAEGSFPVP